MKRDNFTSKDAEECVDPTISQSIVVRKEVAQSEIDRMVQVTETYRDEDEANESKHEAESGLDKFRVVV